ncbi:lipase member H-like, partial [Sitodiplosis mosellana]|uniref:lipase member H-like n=1 Tax=Sitodiplosis mosellana TaxID=263140 RepID=UPI002444A371
MDNITSITKSNFNKNVPTRFISHGFLEYNGGTRRVINDAYLSKAKIDANMIAVNWEKLSQTFNYIAVRNRVKPVGIQIAAMIDFMVKNHLVSIDDITLIGYSLGAHVVGMAGKHVKTGKLPKIVGLDPAGPLFALENPNERLDREDAKYVEVIHTNGNLFGMDYPIGTANFYPNYGLTQPGCPVGSTDKCSHTRSVQYFAESIYSSVPFYGFPCASLEDLDKGKCEGAVLAMGGEPGNYKA